MATATSPTKAKKPLSIRRKATYVAIGLVALVIGWFVYNFASISGQAKLGASYASHIVCSCRYIESRDMKSCMTDFEPGMGIVSISDDPEHKRITASVAFLAKAMAERRAEFGCQQLNDAEMKAAD